MAFKSSAYQRCRRGRSASCCRSNTPRGRRATGRLAGTHCPVVRDREREVIPTDRAAFQAGRRWPENLFVRQRRNDCTTVASIALMWTPLFGIISVDGHLDGRATVGRPGMSAPRSNCGNCGRTSSAWSLGPNRIGEAFGRDQERAQFLAYPHRVQRGAAPGVVKFGRRLES